MRLRRVLGGVILAALLSGCGYHGYTGTMGTPSQVGVITPTAATLVNMPIPRNPISVAVYDFPDLTGQNKPSATVSEFSRAITQGGPAILVDALKAAGRGSWYNVVERGNLDSLLRERKLIQDTYAFLKKDPDKLIKPLVFADYIITGGVISYDASYVSGAIQGTYRGFGGGAGQSRDLVTINIRIIRVKDGEVLRSINVSRPIVTNNFAASADHVYGRSGVGVLSASATLSIAEATQIAVREAIEVGVYQLAREGLRIGLWTLDDAVPASRPPVAGPVAYARGRRVVRPAWAR